MAGLLLVARHGSTISNEEGRFGCDKGPKEILSGRGEKQCMELKMRILDNYKIDAVYSGPLPRQIQTTKVMLGYDIARLSRPYPYSILWDLRERSVGVWAGRLHTEVAENHPFEYKLWELGAFTPPGGEPLFKFIPRVRKCLTELHQVASDGLNVAAVTSYLVIAAMIGIIQRAPRRHWFQWRIANASLTILEPHGRGFWIHSVGDKAHLTAGLE